MSKSSSISTPTPSTHFGLRDWFANHMGISTERKGDIYIDIARSASLTDLSYWLQILFAAGIATLGLALNSPAVIIGAMLISPLMGPILAAGLALASGDIVLGFRALLNLTLSCLLAIAFAVLLVALLPFKEMTAEIAARTQPTTLDLVVALFSGAIGSIAICKEVKGVVTSIPGVAIAVALMPPLCVVGYGIGISFSIGATQGIQVARGGGLLFFTNLVAITFTAMVVFLALHIDTRSVRERVRLWREEHKESNLLHLIFSHIHISENVRKIGSLPGRVMMIALPIILILFPLSQSLGQLQDEITAKRNENRIRRTVTELWDDFFGRFPNGEIRSYLEKISVVDQTTKLALGLTVITSNPSSGSERDAYARMIAERLDRPYDSVSLQVIEIPTTAQLAIKAREENVEPILSVSQLQSRFMSGLDSSLAGLALPSPAQLLSYSVTTSKTEPLLLQISYLSDRDIDRDGLSLLEESVRSRIGEPGAIIRFERIPETVAILQYIRNQTTLTPESITFLDGAGMALKRFPSLTVRILLHTAQGETPIQREEKERFLIEHFKTRWQVTEDRIRVEEAQNTERTSVVRLIPK